jgi:hypothetical protein
MENVTPIRPLVVLSDIFDKACSYFSQLLCEGIEKKESQVQDCYLLGYETVGKVPMFRDHFLPPFSAHKMVYFYRMYNIISLVALEALHLTETQITRISSLINLRMLFSYNKVCC